jgi:16S rRNA (cytosine1402-N4)-methyltransferase
MTRNPAIDQTPGTNSPQGSSPLASAPQASAPLGNSPVGHTPVLLAEMLHALAPRAGGAYLDATFGGGGYADAILSSAACMLWAIDRDPDAIARGARLAARFPGRLHVIEGRFGEMVSLLQAAGVHALDGVVLDLGVSSFQLDEPARGFSFRAEGPLDMRMGKHGTTAAELVNTLPERELADLLFELGEERASRRIARAIVTARGETPIATTGQLAGIIRGVLPPDRSGIDPATRSFQALRIRVNDELGEIERALAAAVQLLAPGGRLVVVAFHSLEDRIVKRFMTDAAGRTPAPSRHDPRGLLVRSRPQFRLLTPRAVRPAAAEVHVNPRARSARLRALERLPSERLPAERLLPVRMSADESRVS